MPTETQFVVGECPSHGEVEAAREVPQVSFPPLINAMRRAVAKRTRPYRCPICGSPVRTD
jgi:hypothetical protein